MKSLEFPPDETRRRLSACIDAGEFLHCSPIEDLDVLIAQATANLAVHNDTGERHGFDVRVSATRDVDTLIMYGVLAISRNPKIYRAVGVDSARDGEGSVIGHRYFASDRIKQIMRERQGRVGAAYRLPPPMEYFPREREWFVTHDIAPLGSLVVSLECLSFDFFDLSSPNSDPKIAAVYRQFDVPAETPPLA